MALLSWGTLSLPTQSTNMLVLDAPGVAWPTLSRTGLLETPQEWLVWPEKTGLQNGVPDKGISQECGVLEMPSECTARPLPCALGLTDYRGDAKGTVLGKCLLVIYIPISTFFRRESGSPLSDRWCKCSFMHPFVQTTQV